MSIHGWNSDRAWQLSLTGPINSLGYKFLPYDYGRKILKILPFQISQDVKRFRDWYFIQTDNKLYKIDISHPFKRPSIIAHSLGSWILAKALIKYPEIKFDKVFLFGSIIPASFDWYKLILGDQINSVIYEKCEGDKVMFFSGLITGKRSTCTKDGFVQKSSFIHEERREHFQHGSFDYAAHIVQILKKYMKEVPHKIRVVSGSKFSKTDIQKYFSAMIKIDQQVYNDPIYQAAPVNIEMASKWFEVEPEIWTFVLNSNDDKVLGYINAVPVGSDTYKEFLEGALGEADIQQTNVLTFENSKSYNLIVLSIAVDKNITEENHLYSKKITEFLMMSFLNKHLTQKSKLNKIAALAWTPEGKRLCQGFNMTETRIDLNGHTVFELSIDNIHKFKSATKFNNANFMAKWMFHILSRPKR